MLNCGYECEEIFEHERMRLEENVSNFFTPLINMNYSAVPVLYARATCFGQNFVVILTFSLLSKT